MNIHAINHVSVLVADTSRSLDFYTGLLGLDIDASRPQMGFPGAWLHVGAGQIHLLQLPETNRPAVLPEHGGRDRHVALNVADLDALATVLESAGINYTRSRSGRRALFCRDPDGNAIELIEVPADTGLSQ
jgi:glyoxylase I family protein